MFDVQSCLIEKDDDIVFIKNKRGEPSRLVFGVVVDVGLLGIEVIGDDGIKYNVRMSQRSQEADKMLNAVVLLPRAEVSGDVLDCSGHPALVGDKVAFMETPSQGFSTSLVVGYVLRLCKDEVTILVERNATQKYIRKPNEIVVVDH